MPPFDDSVGPSGDTSIVPPEDPFLAWYRSQPAAVADDPNEIQMPEADARPPAPTIGFPHDPGPIIDQDATAAAMPQDALANPAVPAETAPPSMGMQPGLGIPSSALDAAAQAPTPTPFNMERFGLESPLAHLTPSAPGGNEADQPAPHGQQLTDAEAAKQFAALSPEAQATQAYRWQQAHDQAERERRDHAGLEDQQRQLENHGRLQRAQAEALARTKQLDADAQAEAKREIDPKWKAGTGKRIGGIIMGIVGGLVQARSGGPNLGLQLIDQEIDRDIEAQKANKAARLQELSRRGATNQQLLALAGDQYADDEHYRLASYARIQNQIASDMQQFDPKGKTAIQLGGMYTSISQARAKALQDFQDKDFKNRVDALKAASALRKEAAETEKLQLESAKLRGALGGGGTGAKVIDPQDEIHPPEHFEALYGPQARPPAAMSFNGYNKWLQTKKLSSEATAGQASLSKEELEHGVSDLKTEDGKPFLAQGSPESVGKLRDQVAAARNMTRLMDEVRAIRTGWTSDLAKSKEWQDIKANWAALKGEAKNLLQLGALSESDYDLVDAFIGSPDPTKWQGRLDGIAKARENIVNKTSTALNASAANGKVKFDIPYIKPEPPKATATDKAQKDALHTPSGEDVLDAVAPSTLTDPIEAANQIANGKPNEAPPVEDALREAGVTGDVPTNDKAHIDQLAVELDSTDRAVREKAASLLRGIVTTGGKGPTAEYARDALHRHVLNSAQAQVDQGGPVTSVTYEEAPPRPATQPNKPKKGGR
jgi:hypothetical protein